MRHNRDPYKIMIAEFMLHRTKAEQVAPVYQKFLKKYPDVRALANTDISGVSLVIESEYKGVFPETREELLRIPSVGDYVEEPYILSVIGNLNM